MTTQALPPQLTGVDHEIWENSSRATLMLKKIDTLGRVSDERLLPGRNAHLTPQERRYNQELAATPEMDFFQNGYLRPVKLLEDQEDTEVLQANVNAMSEAQLRELFTERIRAFSAKIAEVSNPIILERLLELASSTDATVKQVEVVKQRLEELRPSHPEVTLAGGVAATAAAHEGAIRAVTPH